MSELEERIMAMPDNAEWFAYSYDGDSLFDQLPAAELKELIRRLREGVKNE